jgi:hypothetical protein
LVAQSLWQDAFTIGVALLGAILGVFNTWQAISNNRVKLRVRPAHAFTQSGQMFSIEVVNLSSFAMTVSEVGITVDGNTIRRGRVTVLAPILIDGGKWPRRLESRETVSIYFDHRPMLTYGSRLGRAFAKTSCGELSYGSSSALQQIKSVKNFAEAPPL